MSTPHNYNLDLVLLRAWRLQGRKTKRNGSGRSGDGTPDSGPPLRLNGVFSLPPSAAAATLGKEKSRIPLHSLYPHLIRSSLVYSPTHRHTLNDGDLNLITYLARFLALHTPDDHPSASVLCVSAERRVTSPDHPLSLTSVAPPYSTAFSIIATSCTVRTPADIDPLLPCPTPAVYSPVPTSTPLSPAAVPPLAAAGPPHSAVLKV